MDTPDQTIIDQQIKMAMSLIEQELRSALTKFPGHFRNSHEGYAVLLEEVDELWDEIKDNKREGSIERQCNEAVQVGAMAAKFILPYVK